MPPSKKKKRNGKSTKVVTAKSLMKKGGWASLLASGCKHGCPDLPPRDHPVYTFLNLFEDEIKKSSIEESLSWKVPMFLMASFSSHSILWNNNESNEYMNMALAILRAVGTQLILRGYEAVEKNIAYGIMLLEKRIEQRVQWSIDGTQPSTGKQIEQAGHVVRKLVDGSSRDMLRFYSKRIPCSCLDEKYKEAKKSQNKVGVCHGCHKTVERESLRVCSRCKMCFFCSQFCFEEYWPMHKEACDSMYLKKKDGSW